MQFQESRYKMAIDIILICYCNLPEEAMPCILHYRVVNTYISHTKKKKKCNFILSSNLKLALRTCFYNSN